MPADELPLGEDAIELVAGEPQAGADDADDLNDPDDTDDASPSETTLDLTGAGLGVEPDTSSATTEPGSGERDGESADGARANDPAADEPAARRPARKGRGRASVPSWDEIMFGGPKRSR